MVSSRMTTERSRLSQEQVRLPTRKTVSTPIRSDWSAPDGTRFMSARSGNCQIEGTRWAGQDREAPESSGGKS